MRLKLLGCWELISHGRRESGIFKPTSDFLSGRLIYETSGAMSVLIALKDHVVTTDDIIAYSGRFSVSGERVFHHIDVASRSNRVGNSEERLASFNDDDLLLKASAADGSFYEMTWRRVRSNFA